MGGKYTVPESVKEGNLSISAVLDVPLAPGEVKLLSLRSQNLNEHAACIQPAMQGGAGVGGGGGGDEHAGTLGWHQGRRAE